MSKLLKLVQIAKRDLQLSDDNYRNMLESVTGQRSAKSLTEPQLSKVVDRMKQLGFVPRSGSSITVRLPSPTVPESKKIRAIWITMYKQGFIRNGSDAALDAYVKRMTKKRNGIGVEKLIWLKEEVGYVLESLKNWHYRLMCEAIIAKGGRIPKNDRLTGPAGYDKLAKYYEAICKEIEK